MNITDELCRLIDEYEEEKFLNKINSLQPDELKQINFQQITKKLKSNEEFSDFHRLEYALKYDIKYFNQIINEVREEPYECGYDLLLLVALNVIELRYELLKAALLRSVASWIINEFSATLKKYRIYDDFKNRILNGNDKESIIHWLLYIEPFNLNRYYPSLIDLAHEIVETNVFSEFLWVKSRYLLKLSEFITDRETLEYVKEQMIVLVKDEYLSKFELYREYGDDVGAVLSFEFSKDIIRMELIIDDNFKTAQKRKKM